jgi:hypothetical protein
MAKKFSELIKAAFENFTGAIPATLKKGRMLFDDNVDRQRPMIDDGTDVDQLMLEKHLPEARRDTPVQLDDANDGNEVEGVLPILKGGSGDTSFADKGILFYRNDLARFSSDIELVWDRVTKQLQVGTGSPTAQKFTVYGGMAVASGSTSTQSLDVAGTLQVASTTLASVPFPAMTEAERDAVALTPPEGSGVYNTTTKRLNTYDSAAGEWIEVGSGAGGLSYWQKELSADLNTDGTIGDLAVTGLTIGEKYKVTLNVRAVRQATAVDEVQEITFSAVPTYGTFRIGFGGDLTEPIPYDANAAFIQQRLIDYTSIGVGDCVVSGDFATGFIFTFGGALANTDVAEFTIANNTLVSGETGGTNEVQDLVFSATPTGGSFTITFDGQTTGPIPAGASTATVEAALEALPNINGVTVTAI